MVLERLLLFHCFLVIARLAASTTLQATPFSPSHRTPTTVGATVPAPTRNSATIFALRRSIARAGHSHCLAALVPVRSTRIKARGRACPPRLPSLGRERMGTTATTAMATVSKETPVVPRVEKPRAVDQVSSILKDSIQNIESNGYDATATLDQAIGLLQRLHSASTTATIECAEKIESDTPGQSNAEAGENNNHAVAGEGGSRHDALARAAMSSVEALDRLVQRVNESRGQARTSSGQAWKALDAVTSSVLGGAGPASPDAAARALAALAVGLVLAVDSVRASTTKMVASAVLPSERTPAAKRGAKHRKLEDSKKMTPDDGSSKGDVTTQLVIHSMARSVVLGLLQLAVEATPPSVHDTESDQKRRIAVDLHVVAKLESGFNVGELGRTLHSEPEDLQLAAAVGNLVDVIFGKPIASGDATEGFMHGYGGELLSKDHVPPTLSLVANTRPWTHVQVEALVRCAAELDLWYSAELLCDAAIARDERKVAMAVFHPREAATDALTPSGPGAAPPRDSVGRLAAGALIDITFDYRLYRRADAFASKYYAFGGPERFAEARYLHACDTIIKVIKKRQVPIIDKQIERVDAMVAKVGKDLTSPSATGDGGQRHFHGEDIAIDAMSDRIRDFTFRRLRTSNMHAAATRLAKLWGKEYVHDPVQMAEELRERKLVYLQWNDAGCPGNDGSGTGSDEGLPLPMLISDPADLLAMFRDLVEKNTDKTVGFDCEWHDGIKGVALLQLSTMTDARLLDIPALTETQAGCDALRATVGRLFSRATDVEHVIGFGCRDDIKRLRASPCGAAAPWFPPNDACAYEDLRTLIAEVAPHRMGVRGLRNFGLSRACEVFLGKQLDKAEQCSDWGARPLSREQLEYGALDAFVCAAIAAKVLKGEGEATVKTLEL